MSSAGELPLRPGVVRGAQPERPERRAPALARVSSAVWGGLTSPQRVRRSTIARFAARIEAEATGLADLDDAEFDAAVAALRRALRGAGLQPALLRRGFALVREAARRTLGTPHYDVQLYGGWVIVQRGLAELQTGEGKTLTATLPASLAALAGIPVHVITANDYLVERDATEMLPLYERLGLRVGSVVESRPEPDARRAAYACDVTYVTNKQVAFDYLRDAPARAGLRQLSRRLTHRRDAGAASGILRGLCFAIVDEADSVMIDDAGTPLLLSQPGGPVDADLVHAALELSSRLEQGVDFRIDRSHQQAELTERGSARLAELAAGCVGPLAGNRRREEWVRRALYAEHLLEVDRHYVVRDGAIHLIDLPTGRRSPDRAFEGGVNALIEARLGLELTPQRETVARITYQRFFRRYLRLGGMTGTAREVAGELWRVYGLRTVAVPTRLPLRRTDHGLRVLATNDLKWQAVVERVRALHASGRPVLVGTGSVDASEALSEQLANAQLPHRVINAHQDADESNVVAAAGETGRITVATRMAGRGTDIALGPGVAPLGGLAVISTELSEARRIDRQLFGRCARQGEPGSCEQIASLDESILQERVPAGLRPCIDRQWLGRAAATRLSRMAQHAEERRGARVRRVLMENDRAVDDLLAFTGRSE